jgi:hypothetical protein
MARSEQSPGKLREGWTGGNLALVVLQAELGDDALAVAFHLRLGHALEPPEDLQVLLERGATRDEPTELRAVAPVPTWRAHA